MNQNVYQTLGAALSPDHNIRQAAEAQLKQWEVSEFEFPRHLAEILSNNECEESLRQSAGLLLKKYIDKHWSPASDKFEAPLTHPDVKEAIRAHSFHTLSCPLVKVRNASAYVVARLAHFDWPEDWPNFVELMIQLIKSGDKCGVHGSFRSFAEFASKDLSDQQINTVAPLLFPELYKVATSSDFSPQTRVHAVEIFHNFINMIQIVKEANPEIVTDLLAPVLPSWMEFFSQCLSTPLGNISHLSLKIEVVLTLHKLADFFPKLLLGHEAHFTKLVVGNLQQVAEMYSKTDVEGEDFPDGWYETSEVPGENEDEVKLDDFIYPTLELLGNFAQKSKLPGHQALIQDEHTFNSIIWNVVVLHQITKDQEETWAEDPNQFAVEDDEFSLDYSIRLAVQDLIVILMNCYGDLFVSALSSAVFSFVEALPERISHADVHWWKTLEAGLSLVGASSYAIINNRQKASAANKAPLFSLERLFSNDILALASREECPLLTGRFFILTSQFSNALPSVLADQFLKSSVTTISQSPSVLVRVCALKSLNNFCRYLPREVTLPLLPAIFAATSELAPLVTEDILHILLETWGGVVNLDALITAQQSELFLPKLLDIWARNASDHLTSEIVRDLIQDLAQNEFLYPRLVDFVVPGLLKYVVEASTESLVVSSAIDMLTSLTEGGASPLPAGYIATTFPAVLSATTRDDPELHVSTQKYFKAVVEKDLNQIGSWKQGDKSGLDFIIEYICGCFTSGKSESACVPLGPLILVLLLSNTECMVGYLSQILGPLTIRLIHGSTDSFKQSLLVVIAQLCRSHLDTILDFLSNPIGDIQNPLANVIAIWCECHDSFAGFFNIKLSAFALASIFVKNDPRIQNIQVRGRMVDINPGKIVTRSQTRAAGEHYIMVPAPAKILALLLNDCRNDTYSTEYRAEENDDESWADADEFENPEDVHLSELAAEHDQDRFIGPDEEFKSDPLYDLDLKEHLKQMFISGLTNNTGNLQQYIPLLEPLDQKSLTPDALQTM
ncbi:hypothetical protein DSO57_1002253 [Entomophthora muscae]|uniref:Uncharacterized protein n=1 Tax=Entomophthora muscae TaxID=34485 RepID=A0ACC2SXZ8_9FUNG|nr:hypothetical protein DSO57_1002253 [Entomophthora muscae]